MLSKLVCLCGEEEDGEEDDEVSEILDAARVLEISGRCWNAGSEVIGLRIHDVEMMREWSGCFPASGLFKRDGHVKLLEGAGWCSEVRPSNDNSPLL